MTAQSASPVDRRLAALALRPVVDTLAEQVLARFAVLHGRLTRDDLASAFVDRATASSKSPTLARGDRSARAWMARVMRSISIDVTRAIARERRLSDAPRPTPHAVPANDDATDACERVLRVLMPFVRKTMSRAAADRLERRLPLALEAVFGRTDSRDLLVEYEYLAPGDRDPLEVRRARDRMYQHRHRAREVARKVVGRLVRDGAVDADDAAVFFAVVCAARSAGKAR